MRKAIVWCACATVACAPTGGDSAGDTTTGDTPEVGDNEIAVTATIDGTDTGWRCDVGVGGSGEITTEGTRRVRLWCLEQVGNLGQHMISVLVEREVDYAAGTYDIGAATGDTLALVMTDDNGDGEQFITSSTSGWGTWSGQLVLETLEPTARGTVTASWTAMQRMEHSAPSGDPYDRSGTASLAFAFDRP